MPENIADIYKNTPVSQPITPHDECAKECYFIIILTCQFMGEPTKAHLHGQDFFDRLKKVCILLRRYDNRCLKPAAKRRIQASVKTPPIQTQDWRGLGMIDCPANSAFFYMADNLAI